MRRWSRNRRAVQGVWIAATVVELVGIGFVALAGILGHTFPGGIVDPLVIGDLVIALGVAVGMIGAGVRNPWAVLMGFAVIGIVLIGVGVFQWFGPGVRL